MLKNRPLCIFVIDFDETKYMYFFIKDDELLVKHNEILKNVENSSKKELDSEPIYNENYLKAKIYFYNGKNQHKFSQ